MNRRPDAPLPVVLAALALGALAARPAWARRAACALTGSHPYVWCRPADGGPTHLACLLCLAVPRMLSPVEVPRAGCHGCRDCVCKSPPWPAVEVRAADR